MERGNQIKVLFKDGSEIIASIIDPDEDGYIKASALSKNEVYNEGDTIYIDPNNDKIEKLNTTQKISNLKKKSKRFDVEFDKHASPWKFNKESLEIEKDEEAVTKIGHKIDEQHQNYFEMMVNDIKVAWEDYLGNDRVEDLKLCLESIDDMKKFIENQIENHNLEKTSNKNDIYLYSSLEDRWLDNDFYEVEEPLQYSVEKIYGEGDWEEFRRDMKNVGGQWDPAYKKEWYDPYVKNNHKFIFRK